MHNLDSNFEKILTIAKIAFKTKTDIYGNFSFYPRQPKCSDLIIISLAITSDALGIDSENYLFIKIKSDYPNLFKILPDRSNFNRRRRRLKDKIDELSCILAADMTTDNQLFMLDSMPIPICRAARGPKLRIMRDDLEMLPQKGYSHWDKNYYLGYKIHLLTNSESIIRSFSITPANVHDVNMLKELSTGFIQDCTLLGDKGYISKVGQLDLFNSSNIKLVTPKRANQSSPDQWTWDFRKARKRIETSFSQFCDQFMIKRNYAKSFKGFFSRIVTKIAAFTTMQYINFQNNNPLNKLKHALAF